MSLPGINATVPKTGTQSSTVLTRIYIIPGESFDLGSSERSQTVGRKKDLLSGYLLRKEPDCWEKEGLTVWVLTQKGARLLGERRTYCLGTYSERSQTVGRKKDLLSGYLLRKEPDCWEKEGLTVWVLTQKGARLLGERRTYCLGTYSERSQTVGRKKDLLSGYLLRKEPVCWEKEGLTVWVERRTYCLGTYSERSQTVGRKKDLLSGYLLRKEPDCWEKEGLTVWVLTQKGARLLGERRTYCLGTYSERSQTVGRKKDLLSGYLLRKEPDCWEKEGLGTYSERSQTLSGHLLRKEPDCWEKEGLTVWVLTQKGARLLGERTYCLGTYSERSQTVGRKKYLLSGYLLRKEPDCWEKEVLTVWVLTQKGARLLGERRTYCLGTYSERSQTVGTYCLGTYSERSQTVGRKKDLLSGYLLTQKGARLLGERRTYCLGTYSERSQTVGRKDLLSGYLLRKEPDCWEKEVLTVWVLTQKGARLLGERRTYCLGTYSERSRLLGERTYCLGTYSERSQTVGRKKDLLSGYLLRKEPDCWEKGLTVWVLTQKGARLLGERRTYCLGTYSERSQRKKDCWEKGARLTVWVLTQKGARLLGERTYCLGTYCLGTYSERSQTVGRKKDLLSGYLLRKEPDCWEKGLTVWVLTQKGARLLGERRTYCLGTYSERSQSVGRKKDLLSGYLLRKEPDCWEKEVLTVWVLTQKGARLLGERTYCLGTYSERSQTVGRKKDLLSGYLLRKEPDCWEKEGLTVWVLTQKGARLLGERRTYCLGTYSERSQTVGRKKDLLSGYLLRKEPDCWEKEGLTVWALTQKGARLLGERRTYCLGTYSERSQTVGRKDLLSGYLLRKEPDCWEKEGLTVWVLTQKGARLLGERTYCLGTYSERSQTVGRKKDLLSGYLLRKEPDCWEKGLTVWVLTQKGARLLGERRTYCLGTYSERSQSVGRKKDLLSGYLLRKEPDCWEKEVLTVWVLTQKGARLLGERTYCLGTYSERSQTVGRKKDLLSGYLLRKEPDCWEKEGLTVWVLTQKGARLLGERRTYCLGTYSERSQSVGRKKDLLSGYLLRKEPDCWEKEGLTVWVLTQKGARLLGERSTYCLGTYSERSQTVGRKKDLLSGYLLRKEPDCWEKEGLTVWVLTQKGARLLGERRTYCLGTYSERSQTVGRKKDLLSGHLLRKEPDCWEKEVLTVWVLTQKGARLLGERTYCLGTYSERSQTVGRKKYLLSGHLLSGYLLRKEPDCWEKEGLTVWALTQKGARLLGERTYCLGRKEPDCCLGTYSERSQTVGRKDLLSGYLLRKEPDCWEKEGLTVWALTQKGARLLGERSTYCLGTYSERSQTVGRKDLLSGYLLRKEPDCWEKEVLTVWALTQKGASLLGERRTYCLGTYSERSQTVGRKKYLLSGHLLRKEPDCWEKGLTVWALTQKGARLLGERRTYCLGTYSERSQTVGRKKYLLSGYLLRKEPDCWEKEGLTVWVLTQKGARLFRVPALQDVTA